MVRRARFRRCLRIDLDRLVQRRRVPQSCTAARTVATARSSSCRWGSSLCLPSSPGTRRAPTGNSLHSPTRCSSQSSSGGKWPPFTGPTRPSTARGRSATSSVWWCRSERCSPARAWGTPGGWPCGPPSSSARSHSLSCTRCVRPTTRSGFGRPTRWSSATGCSSSSSSARWSSASSTGCWRLGISTSARPRQAFSDSASPSASGGPASTTSGGDCHDRSGGWLVLWLYSQLPIALAVAAAGAGMVSLIEHAADARTPAASELAAGRLGLGSAHRARGDDRRTRRLPAAPSLPPARGGVAVRCGGRAGDWIGPPGALAACDAA